MPVAESSTPPLKMTLMVGAAALLGVVAILFLVTQADQLFGNTGQIGLEPGDRIYRPGEVESLAEAVADAGPLLLPDLAGGDDDVVLQHLGDSDDEGWLALAVRPLAAPRDCFVEWQPVDRTFVDSCDGTVYPEDGEGLPSYPVTIEDDGRLSIDLNVVIPPADG
ncbi:MAG: hypothetical protein AAGD35_08360 [Actinomycetota bacterium]